MTYELANERELFFRQYGVEAIENFALLREVVQALYEDANIILDYNEGLVKVVSENIKNGMITYRWI
jgi:hypothetical protein